MNSPRDPGPGPLANGDRSAGDALHDVLHALITSELAPFHAELQSLRREIEEQRTSARRLPVVLSAAEAARQLGVSRTTLYALLGSTDLANTEVHLPGVTGRRFHRDRLKEWIARHATTSKRKPRRLAPRLLKRPPPRTQT